MEDVAGYRVLRTAGRGDRASALLGFDEGDTVVLKVVPFDDPDVRREIEALERAAGEHVVSLRDVESDGDRTVLVLERLPRGTLADLLDRRGTLQIGEALTILAPLAATLERLHQVGVAHGAVSPTTVCFREDGAPALIGFGRAELFPPGSPEIVRESVAGVTADRDALRSLVGLLLARVAGVDRRLAELRDAAPAVLATALFDLATPTPVRFDAEAAEPEGPRVVIAPNEVVVAEAEEAGILPPWLSTWIPEGLRERVEEPLARVAAAWSGLTVLRRRLVLGGVAGGLTVVALVGALPAGNAPSATGGPGPTPVATPAATVELPEDPVEATILLLEMRERCIRDLSLLCLDDVVQSGSAAASDDLGLIRSLQDGAEYPTGGILDGDPVLVERLGDSALLDLPAGSSPVSVLVLRTTNGWRLRGYLEAPAVTTSGD